ncbi:MAG: RHS repeat-associated core domain-containing protein [Acidobacteriota bacterium]
MNTIKRMVLAAALALSITAPMMAAEEVRYIVILKQRSGAAPDVGSLGGRVEWRQEEQLVVSIPAGAEAKLKADPHVLYLERVGGEAVAEGPLLGTPAEPEAGVSSTATRLRPRVLGNTPWDSGTYSYDGAGNIIGIGSDTYAYDEVQRLKQSTTIGSIETYTYDGFGNMKSRTTNAGTQTIDVNLNTNRLSGDGYSYDGAGNVLTGALYAFTYDALGQPLSKSYDGGNLEYYVYTPSDERIGVQRGSWWNWSVRDEGGKVLRQYRSSATSLAAPALWVEDFVWRDGLLLGSQRPVEMGGRRHYHLDHLGTPRLITSEDGHAMSLHDYYPFGDEKTPVVQEGPGGGGFDREEPMKFTGHERDFAGGFGAEDSHYVDYMHARYYSPTTGRFLSVDPGGWDLLLPQSLNRYSYVLNNPIRYTDPDGTCTNPITCVGEALALPTAALVIIDVALVAGVVFSIGSVTLDLHPQPVVVPPELVNPSYEMGRDRGGRDSGLVNVGAQQLWDLYNNSTGKERERYKRELKVRRLYDDKARHGEREKKKPKKEPEKPKEDPKKTPQPDPKKDPKKNKVVSDDDSMRKRW